MREPRTKNISYCAQWSGETSFSQQGHMRGSRPAESLSWMTERQCSPLSHTEYTYNSVSSTTKTRIPLSCSYFSFFFSEMQIMLSMRFTLFLNQCYPDGWFVNKVRGTHITWYVFLLNEYNVILVEFVSKKDFLSNEPEWDFH